MSSPQIMSKERKAFGKSIFDFQNTQFSLADMKTSLAVGWAYLTSVYENHDGRLTEEGVLPNYGQQKPATKLLMTACSSLAVMAI